jgi:hypothetical protein
VKEMEMEWFIVGFIIGMAGMYKLNRLTEIIKVNFSLMGYGQSGNQAVTVDKVVDIKKKDASIKDTCEFCNDEDIFIAGTKSIMPCPKCKRNAKKA